jgi:8-oxo-dGTP pyrophosphatase MutT (NUDIX family)
MTEIKNRVAGRVIVLDPEDRVLLFRAFDPARPGYGWWATPGGGLDEGETPREAAARELREETGLEVAPEALGDPFFENVAEFSFNGRQLRQRNHFFVLRTERFELSSAGFDEMEQQTHVEARWWSAEELRQTADTYFPEELPELLAVRQM